MEVLDAFNSDAFKLVSLTDRVNKTPFLPSKLSAMGLFVEEPVTTRTVVIEEKTGTLTLAPTVPLGGDPTRTVVDKRKVRSFVVPHIKLGTEVWASELQGMRAFGSNDLETLENRRNAKLQPIVDRIQATKEYHKIGAIKGVILDADGSTVIYNLFTEFGLTESTVDFAFGTATTDIRGKCVAVQRLIEAELGVGAGTQVIHGFCGKTFFDTFVNHPVVVESWRRYQESMNLREDLRAAGFLFGGIRFHEYNVSVGGVGFIADAECRFFPDVPGMYKVYNSPADYVETVNTLGLPLYSKAEPMRFGRGIELEVQANPLTMCLRPKTLVKGYTSN